MGNATTICSDKTGTLTENRMTVVEGFFGGIYTDQSNFRDIQLHPKVKSIISDHIAVNRSCYILYKDNAGLPLFKPTVIGSKTEGALLYMIRSQWGIDEDLHRSKLFHEDRGDKFYSFDSIKKCSTAIILLNGVQDGYRVFVKGASELVLDSCTHFLDNEGNAQIMDAAMKQKILDLILLMASNSLRTLLLGHKDIAELPSGWQQNVSPPAPDTLGTIEIFVTVSYSGMSPPTMA
jgi:magnesium-transporting ATPase (P-type)